jgi:uncharacterized membrane protein YoaK (UPF0700 family)
MEGPPIRIPAADIGLARLMLVLSGVTGMVDAASVLGLGKVFTANMTGNVVFVAFGAVGTAGYAAAPLAAALLTFLAGAALGGRVGLARRGGTLGAWLLWSAAIEGSLLLAAAWLAIGFDLSTLSPPSVRYGIIALTAAAMGYRNATIRQLKVPDLTTTVLTLTLTGLAADSVLAGGSGPNFGRRAASVAAIFLGALAGALLLRIGGLPAPLLAAGLLSAAATITFVLRHRPAANPAASDAIGATE